MCLKLIVQFSFSYFRFLVALSKAYFLMIALLSLNVQVLLHEGGTLLVCLNSIRALNDPTWSWRQDLLHLINEFKSRLQLLSRRNTGSIQATTQ
jgi:hypothetical protein